MRDDVCATALAGPFDVIVDRATLHTLPAARVGAWAAGHPAPRRRARNRDREGAGDGVAGVTTGWYAPAIAALLPGFDVVEDSEAELPGLVDATPIPSRLVVLRRIGCGHASRDHGCERAARWQPRGAELIAAGHQVVATRRAGTKVAHLADLPIEWRDARLVDRARR